MSPLLTGVNVPYSAEYLDREPNDGLLKDLASLVPEGSEPGLVIEDTTGEGLEALLQYDPFRHNLQKATSRLGYLAASLATQSFSARTFAYSSAIGSFSAPGMSVDPNQ